MTRQAVTEVGLQDGVGDSVAVPYRAGGIAVGEVGATLPATLLRIGAEAVAPSGGSRGGVLRRRRLGIADAASTALAVTVVFALFGEMGTAIAALVGVLLVLPLFKLAGLYDEHERRLAQSTLDEAPRLLQLTGLLALAIAILQPVLLPSRLGGLQIATLWVASFITVTSGRVLARWLAARNHPAERCLIVGDVEQARRVRERLAHSGTRARVIGCLPLTGEDLEDQDRPAISSELIRELQVHRLIVVPAATDRSGGLELIRMAKAVGVRVSVVPRIFEVIGSDVEFDEINGLTLLGVRRSGLSRASRLLKRSFDVVMTSVGLLVFAPVMSAIALAVKLDSSGPVFFRQVRVGRDGKHFRMIKFRSMVNGADALKDDLRALSQPGDGLFKIADDPRVTRVGNFLRRTSLDELPQILNVMRGEMSLVGPRPLVVDEDAKVVGLERSRLHLTPGITGPWQILGARLPLHEMIELDYRYLTGWSLWLDMKILLRTIPHVARARNV